MTTRLASLAETDGIRLNVSRLAGSRRMKCGITGNLLRRTVCLHDYSLPIKSRPLSFSLLKNRSLSGRVLVWWSEVAPRLIEWGDRGYRELSGLVKADALAEAPGRYDLSLNIAS
jgi:hypothetical protein